MIQRKRTKLKLTINKAHQQLLNELKTLVFAIKSLQLEYFALYHGGPHHQPPPQRDLCLHTVCRII